MAKQQNNTEQLVRDVLSEIRQGVFRPVYLLMGDEPYYPDMVCKAILDSCIDESEKDFNETVCFGSDVTADQIISAALRFPMMAERQLVVVKEAQQLKDLEDLACYCASPLDSTVLVIVMHRAGADKRKSFYKSASKVGFVLDSPALKDYEITSWIQRYYSSRGLEIEPQAAQLLGEYAGTDLCTIDVETEKLLKNLPEGTRKVSVDDIEKNVGVSRQFSVFELTKALSYRDAVKAVKIASRIGSAAKFALPMVISPLFNHFYRILRLALLLSSDPGASREQKASLLGISPFFLQEYDVAVRNYPARKCIAIISLIDDYDFKGKGGEVGTETSAASLLTELVTKILNC